MKKKRFGGGGPDQAFPAQKRVTEKPEGPGTSLCGLGGKRPLGEMRGLQSKRQMNQNGVPRNKRSNEQAARLMSCSLPNGTQLPGRLQENCFFALRALGLTASFKPKMT